MGIQGLLKGLSPLLVPEDAKIGKKVVIKNNIRQFRNKTLAIDASSWLFKASYSVASRLVEAIEEDRIDPVCEQALARYMIKRCEELITYAQVKRIYLVFDGERCPLKAATNQEREAKRKANLEEARRLKRLGMKDQADDKYKACIRVKDWMAKSVEKAVSKRWSTNQHAFGFGGIAKVKCVFSPFEADAQLAKLCIDKLADAVVTEDSDVLVYSAASNVSFPIIYKLDRDNGDCDVISIDWLISQRSEEEQRISPQEAGFLPLVRHLPIQKPVKESKKAAGAALLSHLVALATRESRKQGFGARMFIQACCLAGCDYAPSQLKNVGFVTAFKLVRENAHRNSDDRFHHILKAFPSDKITSYQDSIGNEVKQEASSIVKDYEDLLGKSELVFYYHKVLDKNGKIVPLTEPPSSDSDIDIPKPKMNRFGDDSFIGIVGQRVQKQDMNKVTSKAYSSRNTSKNTIANRIPKRTGPIGNPYKTVTKKKNTIANTGKNMFSLYAHQSAIPTSSSRKRKTSGVQSTQVPISSSDVEIEEQIKTTTAACIAKNTTTKAIPLHIKTDFVLSDDDNELMEPTSTDEILSVSVSQSSSQSGEKDPKRQLSGRSRYFCTNQANGPISKSSHTSNNEEEGNVRLITPTATDTSQFFPYSDTMQTATMTPEGNDGLEDSSDDDCIIIEEKSTSIESNNLSLSQNSTSSQRSGRFSSTFAQAQRQGTRARFTSPMLSQRKRKANQSKNSKALGRSNKISRNSSIKGFFSPLNQRK